MAPATAGDNPRAPAASYLTGVHPRKTAAPNPERHLGDQLAAQAIGARRASPARAGLRHCAPRQLRFRLLRAYTKASSGVVRPRRCAGTTRGRFRADVRRHRYQPVARGARPPAGIAEHPRHGRRAHQQPGQGSRPANPAPLANTSPRSRDRAAHRALERTDRPRPDHAKPTGIPVLYADYVTLCSICSSSHSRQTLPRPHPYWAAKAASDLPEIGVRTPITRSPPPHNASGSSA